MLKGRAGTGAWEVRAGSGVDRLAVELRSIFRFLRCRVSSIGLKVFLDPMRERRCFGAAFVVDRGVKWTVSPK
jgi:hypothetical protein